MTPGQGAQGRDLSKIPIFVLSSLPAVLRAGNRDVTAVGGSKLALLSVHEREAIRSVLTKVQYVELSVEKSFNREYLRSIPIHHAIAVRRPQKILFVHVKKRLQTLFGAAVLCQRGHPPFSDSAVSVLVSFWFPVISRTSHLPGSH
jgi:hypothetical protein